MRNDLTETNWADEFLMAKCGNSFEDLWASFKSKIYELRNKFVPKTTVTEKPPWNKKGSIPVGKPIQVAQRQKKMPAIDNGCLQRREQMFNARLEYTKARNKVKRLMRQAKKIYEKSIMREIKEQSQGHLVTCATKAEN